MKNLLIKKPFLFQVIQLVYSIYFMLLMYLTLNSRYLLFPGLISFVLGLGITKLKFFRILNFCLCSLVSLFYIVYFYDFLITKGYIREIGNPFFLMGITLHLPIILFNIFFIYFFIKSQTPDVLHPNR